jgi:hypothetical protein
MEVKSMRIIQVKKVFKRTVSVRDSQVKAALEKNEPVRVVYGKWFMDLSMEDLKKYKGRPKNVAG